MNKQLFAFAIVLYGRVYAQEPASLIVHFPFDSYKLSASAKDEIDSFFGVGMRAGERVLITRAGDIPYGDTILVSGYTDNIGTSAYNEDLSVRRALAVKGYLVAKGLPADGRIMAVGYGKRYPLAGNGSDSERAANRRVEILIHRSHGDTVAAVPPVQRDSIAEIVPDTTPAKREAAGVPARKEGAVTVKKDGAVTVQKDGVAPVNKDFAEPPKGTIYNAIMDSTVAVGSTIPLRDVNFFPARHIPLPVSNLILDELARAMKDNPRLRIRIEGHICCLPEGVDGADLGTGQPNLSVQRAKYVYDYLVVRGIAKRRMSYIGLGASGKLYPLEENEEQRAGNRRVEIRIVAR